MKISGYNVLVEGVWLHNISLVVEKGVITRLEKAAPLDLVNAAHTLVPGYVDTQVNGGGGVLFNQTPTYEGICAIATAHLAFGTTSMLPTLITDNAQVMQRGAEAVAQAIDSQHPTIVGIHFEGPFLNKDKKGVHCEHRIRVPTDAELNIITRKDIGKVNVTLAPECVELSMIEELCSEGVTVSLGHTNATFSCIKQALTAGASGFTHLYNAMSQLGSREPGVVGAALTDPSSYCGIIIDMHHVHPSAAKIAIDNKGVDRVMLVTDAMAHVGTTRDSLPFFDTTITRKGDKLNVPNGTLAGSCLDMHGAMLNTHFHLGYALEDAVTMASTTPAKFIGLEQQVGQITQGARANILQLNENALLERVWLNGKPC